MSNATLTIDYIPDPFSLAVANFPGDLFRLCCDAPMRVKYSTVYIFVWILCVQFGFTAFDKKSVKCKRKIELNLFEFEFIKIYCFFCCCCDFQMNEKQTS